MIGQIAMFAPDATLPLRQRVTVEIITVAQARYALEQWHYLHRVRTGRQINYAVLIDGVVDGVPPMHTSAVQRRANAKEVGAMTAKTTKSNTPCGVTCACGQPCTQRRGVRHVIHTCNDPQCRQCHGVEAYKQRRDQRQGVTA